MLHIESIQKPQEPEHIGENSLINSKNCNINNDNLVEKEIDQNINTSTIQQPIITLPIKQLAHPIKYEPQLDTKIEQPMKNFKQLGIFKRMRSSY